MEFDSSGLCGSAAVPLAAASLPPYLAFRYGGGGGFACITQKPLLLSVGSCCSTAFSRLPACVSRLVFFFVSSLFLSVSPDPPRSLPTASPCFRDISSLLLGRGVPQRCALLRINTSSGIRQRGRTAAFQTGCVWSQMLSASVRCLCACVCERLR